MRAPSPYFSETFYGTIWPRYSSTIRNHRTAAEYFSNICHVCDYLEKDFLSISCEDAYRYADYLNSMYSHEKLSLKTINARIGTCRRMSDFIAQNGIIDGYNAPFSDIKVLPVNDNVSVNNIPSMKEFDAILSAAKDDEQLYLILALAGRAALNASTILRLRQGNIIEKDEHVCLYLAQTSAFNQDRVIVLPKDVGSLLMEYLENHNFNSTDGHIFFNKHGRPLTLRNLDAAVEKVVRASGIDHRYTIKDFRSRAIIDLKNAGVSHSAIENYTGLSSLRISAFANAAGMVGPCPADLVNFSLVKSS